MARTGMKFGGDVPVRPAVADIEGQCRLFEIAAMDLDPGCVAGERGSSIRADHEPRRQHQALARMLTSASSGVIVSASSSNRVRPESSDARC